MITVHTDAASTVVCPLKDLNLAGAVHLRQLISSLLEPGLQLVIDLRHVGVVDAVGLSALVGSLRRVRAVGGTASIRNANPHLEWRLSLTGGGQFGTLSSQFPLSSIA
jgi:anti-anti-sigma factor